MCVHVHHTHTHTHTHTDQLNGWEFLAKEKICTVYRKLYKDTGLYQFKVIGRYHDITAKDFYDVQVSILIHTLYGTVVHQCSAKDFVEVVGELGDQGLHAHKQCTGWRKID